MKTFTALLLAVLLASACGDGATEVTSRSPAPSDDAAPELLLRVETGGGFVPVEVSLASFPSLVVADGTAWTPGAQIAIYPPPAVPAVQSAPLSDDEIEALVQRLHEAAPLFDDVDYGQPPISDLPTTTVHAVVDDVAWEAAAYGLDDDLAAEGLTAEQVEARQQLRTLIRDLRAIVEHPDRRWEVGLTPEIRVSTVPVDPAAAPAEEDLDQGPPVAWPEGVTEPASAPGSMFGCVVLAGDERDTLLEAARNTTVATVWQLPSGPHHIVLRPLFPGEVGCP